MDALDAWLADALEWSAASSDYTRRLASAIDARILALVARATCCTCGLPESAHDYEGEAWAVHDCKAFRAHPTGWEAGVGGQPSGAAGAAPQRVPEDCGTVSAPARTLHEIRAFMRGDDPDARKLASVESERDELRREVERLKVKLDERNDALAELQRTLAAWSAPREATTVRDAARRRQYLDGADAMHLEHALTITERERDAATARAVSAEERASKAETLATAERQTRDEVVRRVVELERDLLNVRAGRRIGDR